MDSQKTTAFIHELVQEVADFKKFLQGYQHDGANKLIGLGEMHLFKFYVEEKGNDMGWPVIMCRSPISARFYELMGRRDVMPSGHEFNRWNLPLDQLPKKFLNYRDWGTPLEWNSELCCHQLCGGDEMGRDPFFWMTQDYEVEIRHEKFKIAINRSCSAAILGAIGAQSISVSFDSLQTKLRGEKMVHGTR